MKIIALKGPSSKGKTSTLTLVYDELINLGASVLVAKSILGDPKQKDFECIIEYLGKKIVFYTMGDFSGCTIDAINGYNTGLYDILIIATNDKLVKPQAKISTFPNKDIILKTIAILKTTGNIIVANNLDKRDIISKI